MIKSCCICSCFAATLQLLGSYIAVTLQLRSSYIAVTLQLLALYVAGGIAGSLAHVAYYYVKAQSTGICAHACSDMQISKVA